MSELSIAKIERIERAQLSRVRRQRMEAQRKRDRILMRCLLVGALIFLAALLAVNLL